ncbi:hypothetical protein BC826DRAFT_1044241 [Russula brevipes]|nr:hypothetical protein BC826DRAFT_1044241 [Russula brevipes]
MSSICVAIRPPLPLTLKAFSIPSTDSYGAPKTPTHPPRHIAATAPSHIGLLCSKNKPKDS